MTPEEGSQCVVPFRTSREPHRSERLLVPIEVAPPTRRTFLRTGQEGPVARTDEMARRAHAATPSNDTKPASAPLRATLSVPFALPSSLSFLPRGTPPLTDPPRPPWYVPGSPPMSEDSLARPRNQHLCAGVKKSAAAPVRSSGLRSDLGRGIRHARTRTRCTMDARASPTLISSSSLPARCGSPAVPGLPPAAAL